MKMMSEESYNKLIALTAMCFDANAVFDNMAYSLDYHYLKNIGRVVHLGVAHVMPEWADMITDQMLLLSARPVRLPIGGYNVDYDSVAALFIDMGKTLNNIRNAARQLVESADLDGDDEVRIFAEDFITIITPYIQQAQEWEHAAEALSSPQELDIHFLHYTNFIPLEGLGA